MLRGRSERDPAEVSIVVPVASASPGDNRFILNPYVIPAGFRPESRVLFEITAGSRLSACRDDVLL